MTRYTIDGTNPVNGNLEGDGTKAPFRIFDSEAQDWLPVAFPTRAEAERALSDVLTKVLPSAEEDD